MHPLHKPTLVQRVLVGILFLLLTFAAIMICVHLLPKTLGVQIVRLTPHMQLNSYSRNKFALCVNLC